MIWVVLFVSGIAQTWVLNVTIVLGRLDTTDPPILRDGERLNSMVNLLGTLGPSRTYLSINRPGTEWP